MDDPYRTLNLSPTATPAEIAAAHSRERARLIASDEEDADRLAEQLRAVDEAYAALSAPHVQDEGDPLSDTQRIDAPSDTERITPPSDTDHIGPLAVARAGDAPGSLLPQPAGLAQQACPHCGGLNPAQATMCGQCGRQVSRPCPYCGQAVTLGQAVCARCNTFIPEYDQRRFAEGMAVEQRVQQERRVTDTRVEALESAHTARARQGVVFWLAVAVIGLVLLVALFALPALFVVPR